MGTDDAWALIMLSKASTLKDFKIIGITCVHGNTDLDNCARNTLRVLHAVNRTDVSVINILNRLVLYIVPFLNYRYVTFSVNFPLFPLTRYVFTV